MIVFTKNSAVVSAKDVPRFYLDGQLLGLPRFANAGEVYRDGEKTRVSLTHFEQSNLTSPQRVTYTLGKP
jgi:hypothetical protein